MLAHKIENKINDLKAHLAVVKGDLTMVAQKLADAGEELAKTTQRNKELVKENESLLKNIEKNKPKLQAWEDDLRAKEKDLTSREADLIERETKQRAKMLQEEQYFQERVKTLKEEINLTTVNFERSKMVLEADIDLLEKKLGNLKREESIQLDKINDILADQAAEEAKLGDLRIAVKEESVKLADAKKQTEEERSSKSNVDAILLEREKAVTRREKDVAIVARRLQTIYKAMYPTKDLKI